MTSVGTAGIDAPRHNSTELTRVRKWAAIAAPLIRQLASELSTAPAPSSDRRRQREAMIDFCGPWLEQVEPAKLALTTAQLLATAAIAAARQRGTSTFGNELHARALLALGGCGTRLDRLFSTSPGLIRSTACSQLVGSAELAVQTRDDDPDPFRPAVPQLFFETLLAEMSPGRKRRLGAFYTPAELVTYLVSQADRTLRDRFALPLGLADSTCWAKYAADHHLQWAEGYGDSPVVRIFEPAAGTGAFLFEAIRSIHSTCHRMWTSQGVTDSDQDRLWDQIVRTRLPQQIGGCDMAAEALAVFRLNLLIAYHRSGATSAAEEAIIPDIHCGNALGEDVATAIEAQGPWTVVLGNPPWSGLSKHQTNYTDALLRTPFDSRSGERIPGYFEVDGKALGERKVWLHDDYVKFFRLTQWLHARAGVGFAGLVTNHAFLSNSTFRGMRHSLTATSPLIDVIDLHGNRRRGFEQADEDENVFPGVLQGVSLTMMTRPPQATAPLIRHMSLRGSAREKLARLESAARAGADRPADGTPDSGTTVPEPEPDWETVTPQSPDYELLPVASDSSSNPAANCLTNLFTQKVSGIVTARDAVVLSIDRDTLLQRISDFRSETVSDDELRAKWWTKRSRSPYPPGDTRGWKLPEARRALRCDEQWANRAVRCLRRPFDHWWLYLTAEMVDWPRTAVTSQLLHGDNLALVTLRQQSQVGQPWSHVFVSRAPVESCAISNKQKEICYVYPLYRYPERQSLLTHPGGDDAANGSASMRHANLQPAAREQLADRYGWDLLDDGRGDLRSTFGPEDQFHLIYAILHAPGYRQQFATALFRRPPRIPFPVDSELAAGLIQLGADLVALHLLEDDYPAASWNSGGTHAAAGWQVSALPSNCRWLAGEDWAVHEVSATPEPATPGTLRVAVNNTTALCSVPEASWNFRIGAFRPIQRWLQERARARHELSAEDRQHLHRMIAAISETIRLQSEIDAAVSDSGGWQQAFQALPE